MIQHVEGFQTERRAPVLVDRKDARDLGIQAERLRSPERVPADVSVGAKKLAARKQCVFAVDGAWRGDLREGCGI